MERASTEQVYHVTRIAVDSYEDQVPTGWICNPYLEEALPFHGVTQLLIRMEALLDQLNFPQSFTKNRGMPRSITTAAPSRIQMFLFRIAWSSLSAQPRRHAATAMKKGRLSRASSPCEYRDYFA